MSFKWCKVMSYIKTSKLKPDEIFVIQFDMNDEKCTLNDVIKLREEILKELPEKSSVIILPNCMSIDSMDKDVFRKFLDVAEEFYEIL